MTLFHGKSDLQHFLQYKFSSKVSRRAVKCILSKVGGPTVHVRSLMQGTPMNLKKRFSIDLQTILIGLVPG